MTPINVIGLTLLGLFGILILQKKPKEISDFLLLTLTGLLAAMLISDNQTRALVTPWSFSLHILIPYFLIAVFALYVHFLLAPKRKFSFRDVALFIPGILASVLTLWDQLYNPYDLLTLDALCHSPNTFYRIVKGGYQVFSIAILIPLILKINHYQESLKNSLSYIDPYQLKWLGHLSWIYLVIIVITIVSYGLFTVGIMQGSHSSTHSFVNTCMVIGVCLCCYQGIRQYSWEFFKQTQLPAEVLLVEPKADTQGKYEHSSLHDEDLNEIYKKLLILVEEQSIYLQPKLSVQDLARELQVTAHALSQALNSKTGQTFYDFINRYRVEHLKKLLVDPLNNQYTILALGLESGFNSKASLNRIFKNHTGMTPSAYQQLKKPKGYPSNPRHSLG